MAHIITAEKGGVVYSGSIEKISNKIGVHRNTISNWIQDGKETIFKNGYIIKLNIKKL